MIVAVDENAWSGRQFGQLVHPVEGQAWLLPIIRIAPCIPKLDIFNDAALAGQVDYASLAAGPDFRANLNRRGGAVAEVHYHPVKLDCGILHFQADGPE